MIAGCVFKLKHKIWNLTAAAVHTVRAIVAVADWRDWRGVKELRCS